MFKTLRFYIIFSLLFSLVNFHALGQTPSRKPPKKSIFDRPRPSSLLSLNPFAFIGNSLMLGYETVINDKTGIRINGAYSQALNFNNYSFNTTLNILNPVYVNGLHDMQEFHIEIQPRFYVMPVAPQGFYVAPYAHFKTMSFNYIMPGSYNPPITIPARMSDRKQIGALNLGAVLGYQVIAFDRFVFDTYIGGGIVNGFGDANFFRSDLGFNQYRKGLAIQMGINIGLGFGQTNGSNQNQPANRY